MRMHNDGWAARMPSLPGQRSSVIAIGTTTSCTAHLAADRTTTFTECVAIVNRVLKDSAPQGLAQGWRIVVTREGGTVTADGRTMSMSIGDQELPKPQEQCVFFLRYRPVSDDYSILTSYRIADNRVHPVDQQLHFQTWSGDDLTTFLAVVISSIQDESRYLPRQQLEGKP